MLTLLAFALSTIASFANGSQEVWDAANLERRDWGETQAVLRAQYPLLLRAARIGAVPVVIAQVDAAGAVSNPVLSASSGHTILDEGALKGAPAFRFRPPVRPGLYRIRVPLVVDSLLPLIPTEECFPRAALVGLLRATAYPIVNGDALISEWTFRPVGDPRDPDHIIPHRLRVTASQSVERRCMEVLDSWTPLESDSISSGRPGFTVCGYNSCEATPQPEREYSILIADYSHSWGVNEWTFEVEAHGYTGGSWTLLCQTPRTSGCEVASRPPRPIT